MTTDKIPGHTEQIHQYNNDDTALVVYPPSVNKNQNLPTSKDYVEYFNWGYRNKMGTGDGSNYTINGSPIRNQLKTTSAIPRNFIKDYGPLDLGKSVNQHTSPESSSVAQMAKFQKARVPANVVQPHSENGFQAGGNGAPSDMWEENGGAGGFQNGSGAYSDKQSVHESTTNPLQPKAFDDHDSPQPAQVTDDEISKPALSPANAYGGGSAWDDNNAGAFGGNAYDNGNAGAYNGGAYDNDNGLNPLMSDANDRPQADQIEGEPSKFAYKPAPRRDDLFLFDKMRPFVDNLQSDKETGNLKEIGATEQDRKERQALRMDIAKRNAHRTNAKNRRLSPNQIAMGRNNVQKDSAVDRVNDRLRRDGVRGRREFFDKQFEQMGYPDHDGEFTKTVEQGLRRNRNVRANVADHVADARIGLADLRDLWRDRDDLKTPGPEKSGRLALEMAFLKATGRQSELNTEKTAQRQEAARAAKDKMAQVADDEDGNADSNLPRAAFGLEDQDRRADFRNRVGDAFDAQEENIDEMQVLSDEAIEAGVEDLKYWMNDPKAKLPKDFEFSYRALHAMSSDKRKVDGYQFSEQEIASTVSEFRKACKAHNAEVEAKNKLRADRRDREATSSFPTLKMTLSTSDKARWRRAGQLAADEVIHKHRWAGNVLAKGLAWMFQKTNWKWVKNIRTDLAEKKREMEVRADHIFKTNFDDENLQEMKSKNFNLTRAWLTERYDYDKHVAHPDPERPHVRLSAEALSQQDMFDPENVFTAMAEYADDPQGFIDEIRKQVADALEVNLTKRNFDTPEEREETLKMRQLVNAVTEGIYEGILSAAAEQGGQQLGIRAEAAKTLNADHYVQITGAHCALTADTAWQDVNFAINNVYDADLRNTEINAHEHYANGTLAKIDKDLNDSWETDGVFEAVGGGRFGEETQIIHLPIGAEEDAPRRAIVRHNVDVTKAEVKAAYQTAHAVNNVIGAPNEENTIAGAAARLDGLLTRDTSAVDSNNPFSTAPSREESFDAIRQEIQAVKERVADVIHKGYEVDINGTKAAGLKDHQIHTLNWMVKDLEFRANQQEQLHDVVEQYNDVLAQAKSPEDLDINKPVGGKLNELEQEMNEIAGRLRDHAEKSKVADAAITDRELNKTLQEVQDSKSAVVQIHGEYKAAKAALDGLKTQVRENTITPEDAMRKGAGITRAFEKILHNRRAQVSGYSDALANQFDEMGKVIAAEHDQLFAAVCKIDTGGKAFSPEASNAIRQMEDAKVLDGRTINALQQMFTQQKFKGAGAIASGQVEKGNREFSTIDHLLRNFGGSFDSEDAQYALHDTTAQLFPEQPDAQLRFKRNLNTAAGQRGVSNDVLKFQHYAMDVLLRVENRNVGLDKAADFYDPQPAAVEPEPQPKPSAATESNGVRPSYKMNDVDEDDVRSYVSIESADDDVDGFASPGIEGFLKNANRFENHPLVQQRNKIEAAGGDDDGNWFQNGLDAIEILYENGKRSDRNQKLDDIEEHQSIPLTSAQMENAAAVLELLEAMPSTKQDVEETQREMVKEKVGFTQQNLKLALGFDPKARMDDPNAVSKQIDSVITNNVNEEAIKDLQASHRDAMGLLQTQTEIASTVRAALVEPMQEFATHLENENVDTNDAEAVTRYIQSDKFKRQRETLRNVAAVIDLSERRDNMMLNGSGFASSDRYVSAGKQMVELAQHVRNFNPNKMKADTKRWADIKELLIPKRKDPNELEPMSEEEDLEEAIELVKAGDATSIKDGLTQMQAESKAERIALDLRWSGGKEIADRFAKVEANLNMLSFLEESNADIQQHLEGLSTQYDGLLNDVQDLQKDRAVQLAILQSLNENNPVLDDEAISNARELLGKWGQAAAWKGFEERHGDELAKMRLGGSAQEQVLDSWRQNAKGLPEDIQNRMTALNDAIMSYEALLKESGNSICALTDTDDLAKAKDKIAPTTNGILQDRINDRATAEEQFSGLFVNPHGTGRNETDPLSTRPWSEQAQWRRAGGLNETAMKGMSAAQITPRLYNTLAAVGDQLGDLKTRYEDMTVQNAIIASIDEKNPTFDDETILRAKALLEKNGQSGNWEGFKQRHAEEMQTMRDGGASQDGVLEAWRERTRVLDPQRYSAEDIDRDRGWIGQNVSMLEKMEELDKLVHETQVKKDLFGWQPSQNTRERIQTLTNELRADHTRLNPETRQGRAHRYQHVRVGRAHGYWRQRKNQNATFLNQMDNALHSAVRQQIQNVPKELLA